jgi:FixJ family two-component response regulator
MNDMKDTASSTERKPILIFVDDEEDLLEIYEDRFRRAFEVKCFVSPLKLIEEVKSGKLNSPDVIITDLRMAEIDGIEMIRTLRQAGLMTPAILLSGNLDSKATEAAVAAGVSRIMDKPFKESDLRESIRALIAAKS